MVRQNSTLIFKISVERWLLLLPQEMGKWKAVCGKEMGRDLQGNGVSGYCWLTYTKSHRASHCCSHIKPILLAHITELYTFSLFLSRVVTLP